MAETTPAQGSSVERKQYYLRAYPDPESSTSSQSSRISGLYLRLHGSGTDSMLLTPASPIYLRGHFEPVESLGSEEVGRVIFTSPAELHAGRSWGMALTTEKRDTRAHSQWERAEINEVIDGSARSGWVWEPFELETASHSQEDSSAPKKSEKRSAERLVWKGGPISVGSAKDAEEAYQWEGWFAMKSSYGHPQLFWLTDKFKAKAGTLPEGAEKVFVVREWL